MSALPQPTDAEIRDLLTRVKTIALVGASNKPHRDSYRVMQFLQSKGYRVIPVNPSLAGETLLGETVFAQLADVPDQIDLVDIFRNSDAAGQITEQAIEVGAGAVWMQLGVVNEAAARKATEAGLQVIMDHCPKIEIGRLGL